MPNVLPKNKVICSSAFELSAVAFDQINWRPAGAPPNDTLNADTPKGVLGGSVATGNGDWESKPAAHNSAGLLGIYSDDSEGKAYENNPAAASGKLGIYMHGGTFDVFVFETYAAGAPYASILGNYGILLPLFVSPFGLLTPVRPTTLAAPYGGGVDHIVGYCTKVPTPTSLTLGLKLVL